MAHIQKMTLKDANGKEYICACFRLYGCPIWIPVNVEEDIYRQLDMMEELFATAVEVSSMLYESMKLAKQTHIAKFYQE